MRIFVAIFLGAVLGGLLAKFIFDGSAWNLILWAVTGIGIGIFARSKKEAGVSGALYGFVLSFLFMVRGYQGTAPLVTRFAPFAVLGLFGAVCGTVLGLIGSVTMRLFIKEKISVVEKRG
jgi:hypothetical protein